MTTIVSFGEEVSLQPGDRAIFIIRPAPNDNLSKLVAGIKPPLRPAKKPRK